MNVKYGLFGRWLVRLLLLALLALPLTRTGVAEAADPPSLGADWDITFEVVKSKVRAIWTGRVWDYSTDEGKIIAQKRIDISAHCQLFGGVVIGASDVTFDGLDDYITCEVPNYPQIFVEMVPELGECRCFYDSPPYATADISPLLSPVAQPVVYHERLRLDVLHVDAKPQEGLARFSLHFPDGSVQQWQSNPFSTLQKNGFQIWAGYDAVRFTSITKPEGWAKFLAGSGFWGIIKKEYAKGFLVWESQAAPNFSAQALPSGNGLGPGSTVAYIGYNPETGAHYNGKLRVVAVDPGCRGH